MCSIAWRWSPDQTDSLVLISNRDEFFDRPTEASAQWPGTNIWAGKDKRAGGTWLGVTDAGRLAAITNHRCVHLNQEYAASRGNLVTDFLVSNLSSQAFMESLADKFESFNPFNLLVFDGDALMGFEGRVKSHRVVQFHPGFGTVSNADFNTPWFKQQLLQASFQQLLNEPACTEEDLLDLLLNNQTAPLNLLPETGLSIDKEIALSSLFVQMKNYGTRASSLVRIRANEIHLRERSFETGAQTHQVRHVLIKSSK